MTVLKKQLKLGEVEPEVLTEVAQILTRPAQIVNLIKSPSEYEEIIIILENYMRELDARLEMAHKVLPELEKQDTLQYIEAHRLYRELLWKWQRARLAYLMLKLEHPNYNTDAMLQIEKEQKT